jgi:predicted murein hydrolase (TIGR00659 family)
MLDNPIWTVFLILSVYFVAMILRRRTGNPWVNPLIIATFVLIFYIQILGIPYEKFKVGADMVDFWLKPAVVVLAVPLYLNWDKIRKQWLPIMVSQAVGSVVGLFSGVLIAHWMGANKMVSISLAAKSVTTPIAIEVTHSLGGAPSITVVAVILAGLTGQMLGLYSLRLAKVNMPSAQGLSLGTASHALGTSAAFEKSGKYAAYASVGLIFNGILTAFLAPVLVPLLPL